MVASSTGQCNICGWQGAFLHQDIRREGNHCGNCSASSRHRAVIRALGNLRGTRALPLFQWEGNTSFAILESSPRGSYPAMLADKFDYYATEYDPAKIAEGKRPREFADFQNLHFEESTFDVVIASDVFEHIRDDVKGYREILRVLKPGGSLLLTVPYDHNRPATIVRVDTTGERDVHLREPEFHGGGGHTLTYRNYGRDLLSLLYKTGYAVCHQEMDIPAYGITPQSVILARKGEFTEVADRSGTADQLGSLGVLVPHRLFLLYRYTIRGFIHYWHEMKRK